MMKYATTRRTNPSTIVNTAVWSLGIRGRNQRNTEQAPIPTTNSKSLASGLIASRPCRERELLFGSDGSANHWPNAINPITKQPAKGILHHHVAYHRTNRK